MTMDKWDIPWLGRILGGLIMLVGVLVTGWSATDLGPNTSQEDAARYFLLNSLNYAYTGGVVVVLAEVAERLGWLWSATAREDDDDEQEEADETTPPPGQ